MPSEWKSDLYELNPLEYLSIIQQKIFDEKNIKNNIKTMIYLSKYGSNDGKDFENALKESFDLFREVIECEHIGGSGDTDIICKIQNEGNITPPYKINIDAKKSKKSTAQLNPKRLILHIEKHNSKYCIVVSSRFAKGVKNDIDGKNVVIIEAETLGRYISKECLSSDDGYANFTRIDKIIEKNYGKDITPLINKQIDEIYSF
ncbi:hypothetical protein EPC67_03555 [Helicobacter pylori]|uniref:restriction endonuclease n=1 Tax=Helicobacter pylori TaxID=210 RepID=UPI00123C4B3E|nr:restriction endonuclease [Helicobacter pylori]KAA6514356.1 hypothetical protein EPC67_03555 [Helicobacter pylori]